MKKLLTLILLFISQFCFAQNLVPNWSFEDTISCPSSVINNAAGWSSYRGSSDYFNSCNNLNLAGYGIPTNVWGYQNARTGNAYAGLVTYDTIALNFREYIGIQLSQSLIIGQKYFASFYVSKAVNGSYFSNHSYGNVETNKIGMRLSTVPYSISNWEPTDNHAQIFADSIIADTSNWVKISGSFISDSAYLYLGIGNFFQDSATTYVAPDTSSILAYYYIDDVYLSIDSTDEISELNNNALIKFFPNPSKGDFTLMYNDEIKEIIVIDLLGNEILVTTKKELDLSGFSNGIYFYRVTTRSGKNYFGKVIKE